MLLVKLIGQFLTEKKIYNAECSRLLGNLFELCFDRSILPVLTHALQRHNGFYGVSDLRTLDTGASFHGRQTSNYKQFSIKKYILCGIKLGTLICDKNWGSGTRFPKIIF